MRLRLCAVLLMWVSSFVVVGCSDTPSQGNTPADPPHDAVPEPVPMTKGVLHYDGLPPSSVEIVEVLIVEKLSAAARERIERQRVLFEYKITNRSEPPAQVSVLAGVSAADGIQLLASLEKLSEAFPAVLVNDIDMGNNRLQKYQSDRGRFNEYQYLFGAIKLDNLERGLTSIADKIELDNKALVQQADQLQSDNERYQEVRVTLDWLQSLQAHYYAYAELAKHYFDAKNRYIEAKVVAESRPAEPTDWNAYAVAYANLLVMDTAEFLLGAAFAAEDGSFEAEGHGIVVVRAELAGTSAYFIPGSEKEKRVWIENLQQF